jgi:hypothetical protein
MGWQDDPIIGQAAAWESDVLVQEGAAATGEKAVVQPATARRAIGLGEGLVPPTLFTRAENPNSAGFYPLGRRYSIGDRAAYRITDQLTGIVERENVHRVTAVDAEHDEVEINNGLQVWDLMGNLVRKRGSNFSVPRQFAPAELYVGKKWAAVFDTEGDKDRSASFDFRIVGRERIRVPAGEFYAFRIEGSGWVQHHDGKHRQDAQEAETIWLLPYLNFPIRHERVSRNRRGKLKHGTQRHELVWLRQMASLMPAAAK